MKAASRLTKSRGLRHFILFSGLMVGSQFAIGANDTVKASAYYENALEYYNNEQYDEAVIQLKNAFQENPKLLPALVLLGKSYLETGNPTAAETALTDALELGADLSLVVIPLANTYLAQYKHDLLLAETVPDTLPLQVKSELHLLRARAALETNNQQALNSELVTIEQLTPTAADLLSLKATLRMRDGKFEEAQEFINRLKDLYPEEVTTWLADASINQLEGDISASLKSYNKVIDLDPNNDDARIGRLTLLIDRQEDSKIAEDFEFLTQSTPSDPRVIYLRAVNLARINDKHGSTTALNEALNILDALGPEIVTRNLQLLMIAGIANYNLGNLETAREHLETYVKSAPNELAPQRLLASIYMRQGEHKSAISLLKSVQESAPQDSNLLSMLAQAYSGAGNHQQALLTYEKALKITDKNPQLNTQWAISKLNAGFLDEGLDELEKLFYDDASQNYSAMPLAITLLQNRNYSQALEIAKKLVKKDPENLAKQNLLGVALASSGETEQAKELFNKLLQNHPDNIAIKRNLAKIAKGEGKFESARAILSELLAKKQKDPELMLEMSQLLEAEGNPTGALRWAKDAASEAPQSFTINHQLIRLLTVQGNFEEALKAVLNQEAIHPNNLHVLEAQANVLMAAQKQARLLSLLRQMATLADFNTQWLLKIARYQVNAGSLDEASYTLFRGLQGSPGHMETRILLAEVEIRLNRLDLAMERAKQLISDHPKVSEGYRLVGDVRMQRQQFNEAATGYQDALEREDKSLLVLRLFAALQSANQNDKAKNTLLNWLNKYPEDYLVKNALADFYLTNEDFTQAVQTYQMLLTVADSNPYLHNNLANALSMLGKKDDALAHAQQAYHLASTDPMISDTLGWLLIKNNQADKGLPYLREALTRAPGNGEIRYHLAVALHKASRNSEALRELNLALESNPEFIGHNDARKLLQKIQNQ